MSSSKVCLCLQLFPDLHMCLCVFGVYHNTLSLVLLHYCMCPLLFILPRSAVQRTNFVVAELQQERGLGQEWKHWLRLKDGMLCKMSAL